MGSDKARISYDENQQYRSVVSQQGRVTLEADANESWLIADEETRREALDLVGVCGTPDDGFRITPLPAFDFQIKPGTMYVGGIRAYLPASDQVITYLQQPDLLLAPNPIPSPPKTEYVYLHLLEQEISPVEDADLKDVALGGPDSSCRTRILRHVERLAIQAQDCSGAFKEVTTRWSRKGLDLDPTTLQLMPQARMMVSFVAAAGQANPCEPTAQGGYLGAENQLIRVQISDSGKFLWGYDNASFLYRVDVLDPKTLRLQASPVDDSHRPRGGQAVEVLRATARLSNGEFVAHASELEVPPAGTCNLVTTLAAPYNDDHTVQVSDALPADFQNAELTPRLFLRVWEQQLDITPGAPVSLGATGIQITFQNVQRASFHAGDYWLFAVRPTTPQKVYPERYLDDFQPANGPRQWVCPLGVIGWTSDQAGTLLDDCRNTFDNLVTLSKRTSSGCCAVSVRPQDVTSKVSLQAIVDKYKKARNVTICLMPGVYSLTKPLRLGAEHSGLTLEGCAAGVVLRADPDSVGGFQDGLIVLTHADEVTLSRLTFQLPLPPMPELSTQVARLFRGKTATAIALRPVQSENLTVTDCTFIYPSDDRQNVFAAGIFCAGDCRGWTVERNLFSSAVETAPPGMGDVALGGSSDLFVGFLLYPVLLEKQLANPKLLRSTLGDASISHNRFERLSFASLIAADTGRIEHNENTIVECNEGLVLVSLHALAFLTPQEQVVVDPQLLKEIGLAWSAIENLFGDTFYITASFVALFYPLPSGWDPTQSPVVNASSGATKSRASLAIKNSFMTTLASTTQPAAAEAEAKDAKSKAANVRVGIASPQAAAGGTKLGVLPNAARFVGTLLNQFDVTVFEHELSLSLDMSHNAIDVGRGGAVSGGGIFVADFDTTTTSSLTMSSNRVRNNSPRGSTITVYGLDRSTLTGNVIANEADRPQADTTPRSLLLLQRVQANKITTTAVTGNVLFGASNLGSIKRPGFQAPLDDWRFANTEA